MRQGRPGIARPKAIDVSIDPAQNAKRAGTEVPALFRYLPHPKVRLATGLLSPEAVIRASTFAVYVTFECD